MAPSEGKILALGQLKAVARHPRTQWRSVSRWSAAQGTGQDTNVVTNEDLAAKALEDRKPDKPAELSRQWVHL